ncbi:MAG TPA: uracil-DNA glycosylase [Bacteroidia bacterium]|nr:uracil-DNA glycosylase [Bacteroidia bacterium]HNT81143.1 uracil-DNA glycosylase [Bacteroidia bacterium]
MNFSLQEQVKGGQGRLSESWMMQLGDELNEPYMLSLKEFLLEEQKNGNMVYPPRPQIFSALNHVSFEDVKVVIIGQDPYHGRGQANGLCFSVSEGVKAPPSLKNIFKEIESDIGISMSGKVDLTPWAKQGVLLLNATLTVRAGQAGSHQNRGWEQFTDRIISHIAEHRQGVVFLLWGKYAQAKQELIDQDKHHILVAAHPSPYSAYNGFFGNKHFSKCNQLLMQQGLSPINWAI